MFVSKNSSTEQQVNTLRTSVSSKHSHKSIANKKENENQSKRKTIYAGATNIAQHQDDLADKQVKAQKKAMKLKLDQFSMDNKIDDTIDNFGKKQTEFTSEALLYQKEIDHTRELAKELKESYGIDDDSDEQKNLELLERSLDPNTVLSNEEEKQLESMGPLTDYQKSALRLYATEQVWTGRYNEAKNNATSAGQTIDAIKLETLKSHPMTDAQKEAEKILESTSKELIGTLTQEAKNSMDKEMEDMKKDAEKKAEEKKEKEEQIEKQKENAEAANGDVQNDSKVKNDSTDQIQEAAKDADKIITDIKNFINKNNVLDEDAKGLLVDSQL